MKTRALTTSEAVAKLLELGFENHRCNTISDNEFTEPFGASYTNPNPPKKYNQFTKEWYYDEYEGRISYCLSIDEYADGTSYLRIHRFEGHSGTRIFDYAKANAATKKRFIEVMEKEAKK
jgi:hypothetical protein